MKNPWGTGDDCATWHVEGKPEHICPYPHNKSPCPPDRNISGCEPEVCVAGFAPTGCFRHNSFTRCETHAALTPPQSAKTHEPSFFAAPGTIRAV